MRSLVFVFIVSLVFPLASKGQYGKVFTSDIDNFWIAYDSIQTTNDSLQQLHFIQTLYIDKGTPGLKAFMTARNYSAELWIMLIHRCPKFWISIRPNTLTVKSKTREIEAGIAKLRKLYPQLKEAKVYFTIGGLRSGGTIMGDMVLIGSEIASANADTEVSEFPNPAMANIFKTQDTNNIVSMNIHEYVHTQQRGMASNLLGQSIREGSCDFIAELVMEKPLLNHYILYGNAHEQKLKEQFKEEMNDSSYENWLYNGHAVTVGDLGYFMGYAICKSYYQNATNKMQAIKEIIELDYSDSNAVQSFCEKSKYY